MRSVIVCYVDGPKYEAQLDISGPLIERYAKRIDADFAIIREPHNQAHGEFAKFLVYDVFKQYDRALFLDVDVIIQGEPPNIFDVVPRGRVGAFNEMPYLKSFKWFWDANKPAMIRRLMGLQAIPVQLLVNSGVFVLDTEHADLYKPTDFQLPETLRCAEQSVFSMRLQESGLHFNLSQRWNCIMALPSWETEYKEAHFVHFNCRDMKRRLELMRLAALEI